MKKILFYNGKEIPYYSVDMEGNIYITETGYKMTEHETWNGYKRVRLSVGIERKMYLVHRLVASTFLENPENYPVVNHKNNDRGDNRVANLEWCTNSKNQKQRFETHKGTKRRPVKMMDLKTKEVIRIFDSPIDATRELGIAHQNINKVVRGRRKSAGGYYWEYV